MDGVAQVVQQFASELSLVVLLNPIQDSRVGGRGIRFQTYVSFRSPRRNYRPGWGVPGHA
jgi:hypothetical protein